MTKQVELFTLTETKSTSSGKTGSANNSKKEGASLFDSLLMQTKKDFANENKDISNNKQNFSDLKNDKQQEVQQNTKNNVDKNTDSKILNTQNDDAKTDDKKESLTEKKEIKAVKISSLLDKMILEANKKIDVKTSEDTESLDNQKNNLSKESVETNLIENEKSEENGILKNNIENKKADDKNDEKDTKIDSTQQITSEDNLFENELSLNSESKFILDESKNLQKNEKQNSKESDTSKIGEEELSPSENIIDKQANNTKIKTISFEVEDETVKNMNLDKKDLDENLELKAKNQTLKNEDKNINNITKINSDNINQISEDDIDKDEMVSEILNTNKDISSSQEDEFSINKDIDKSVNTETNLVDLEETKIQKSLQTKEEKNSISNIDSKEKIKDNSFEDLDKNAFLEDEQKVNFDKNIFDETADTLSQKEKTDDNLLIDDITENDIVLVKNQSEIQTSETQITEEQTASQKSNDFVTNIFLSSQKNSMLSQMIMNKSEAIKTVKEGNSVKDIKDAAEILDLGLKNLDVSVEESSIETSSNEQIKKAEKTLSLLDKLTFNQSTQIQNDTSEKETDVISQTQQSSATNTVNNNLSETDINVNPDLALSIQNRIIGARQFMSSMMSDIARSMYENYKPPVTAFRINLMPATLGHIAVLMKNDKDNSVSINLTMSQSSTHDAMVENQTVLKDALNKTFNNEQNSFNLNFNMDGESNSNNTYSQPQDNQDKQNNQQHHSSDEILESRIENKDVAEDINYM